MNQKCPESFEDPGKLQSIEAWVSPVWSGVLRCKGRIANADLPYKTTFPALLPKDHYILTLLVRQAHERVHHNKVEATLAQLRTKFWIMKGRQFVKRTLANCAVCSGYEGRSYRVFPPSDLAEFRMSQKTAFTCRSGLYWATVYKGVRFDNVAESVCSLYLLFHQSCSPGTRYRPVSWRVHALSSKTHR